MPEKARWSVYPPREDTFLLLPFAHSFPGERVADVGTGNGALALAAARDGAEVVATDVNPVALRELRTQALGESLRLEVVRTHLLRGLPQFDRILVNPPYLPTRPDGWEEDLGDRRALAGGEDGLEVTREVFRVLPDHLAPKGRAYILSSTLQDVGGLDAVLADWRRKAGRATPVASRPLEGERLTVWECTWREPPGPVGARAD